MTLIGTAISFNSNSLQTDTIVTSLIDHESIPTKDAKFYSLAHSNSSKIPFVDYPNKMIQISGQIISSTIVGLDSAIDTFKSYFISSEKNLDIGYNGGTRRYIATAMPVIKRPKGLLYANFDINFECSVPFGIDTNATSILSASGRTSSNYNDAYTFLGTAPFQLMTATLTMTTITDTDSRQLIWGNGGNGQVIIINRIFTSGDVVVIDCVNKSVTINGSPVAFVGAFPEFAPGAQTIQYTDTFTSRTFGVDYSYIKRWL